MCVTDLGIGRFSNIQLENSNVMLSALLYCTLQYSTLLYKNYPLLVNISAVCYSILISLV
jgi:hypothetical protein